MAFATFQLFDNNVISVALVAGADGVSESDLNGFLQALESFVSQGAPFALIIDASQVQTANMMFATRIAEFMKAHQATFKQLSRGTAMVVTAPVVRNVINMVFSLQKPESPFRVVNTLIEAHAFVSSS